MRYREQKKKTEYKVTKREKGKWYDPEYHGSFPAPTDGIWFTYESFDGITGRVFLTYLMVTSDGADARLDCYIRKDIASKRESSKRKQRWDNFAILEKQGRVEP